MNSKSDIIAKLLSTFKRRKPKHKDISNEYHHDIKPISPPSTPPLVDSAFASSCIKPELAWEEELEQIHQQGEYMELDWYQCLSKLTTLVDKVTSPFHNTNRVSLHCTQQFIEEYLDDWKSQRYEREQAYEEKIQQAGLQFSDQVELKSCVVEICGVEKNLFIYRQTMDTQLTLLWNTRQKDQDMTLWTQYSHQFHHASDQMETKFKDLLENATPKPDDYTCAVCLSIFTDPVTLHPCLHTFCKSCVQHIYCTCQLTQCDSSCHETYTTHFEEDDDNGTMNDPKFQRRLSMTYKPRYRSIPKKKRHSITSLQQQHQQQQQQVPIEEDDSAMILPSPPASPTGTVNLQCDCPLSWSVPPAAQCPLCRHPFGPEDCSLAIGLDNLIRFYFPRQDRVRQKYHARQRRLKCRSILASLSQNLIPSGLPSVPLPLRRQAPSLHTIPPSSTYIPTLSQDLASLASQTFIV